MHGAAPLAPLPAKTASSERAASTILDALAKLGDSVERIERQLSSTQFLTARPETLREEEERVKRELAVLLERIREVERSRSQPSTDPRSLTAGVDAEDPALELGRLRREQARMVFRIEELRNGSPSDESFLT